MKIPKTLILVSIVILAIFSFAVMVFLSKEPTKSPWQITRNDLPIVLRWSKFMPYSNYSSTYIDNLACNLNIGAAESSASLLDNEWQGLIIFDENGNVLWNRPEHSRFPILINDGKVIVFDRPYLLAYDIYSGKLNWKTEVGYRLAVNELQVHDMDNLSFSSMEKYSNYTLEDGAMLDEEDISSGDFLLRHDMVDIYGRPEYIEATVAKNRETQLWYITPGAKRKLSPIVYKNNLIIQFDSSLSKTCSVNISNGQLDWCNDTSFLSNIATRGDVGYGITGENELIAIDLTNGDELGKTIFQTLSTNEARIINRIATCEEHLLVFMTSPEELFWFDFIPNNK